MFRSVVKYLFNEMDPKAYHFTNTLVFKLLTLLIYFKSMSFHLERLTEGVKLIRT